MSQSNGYFVTTPEQYLTSRQDKKGEIHMTTTVAMWKKRKNY